MLRINLDQLRTFLIVVRSGGVVKAAQSLNLTQPAVTARMKGLEQTLGTQVFDRSAGQNRLTKQGELLLQYALKLEVLSNQIERDIVDPAHLEGHLRLGASETIAQSWMPDFITELSKRFPRLQIEFNVDVSVSLRNALLAREIDLAFLLGPVSEYSVDNIALPRFELDWYAAADAPDDPALAARLFDKPVITYAKNTRPYRDMRDQLQEHVETDTALFPSSSLSAAIRLVETGLGVGALPRLLADPFVAAGTLKTFNPGWAPEPLTFTASYIADPRSQMIESAAQLAAEVAQNHV
ncbi:LysR family transcriptional regulator [Roseibium denhamense]|uniref:Transcriptional regulator, LysR family n=1 Tax=Roseibium denhamense TaxID=76305 RepID=A0ABY1NPK7_9HYPH|nr:LysR family transcriptional regulator [Roseibium denhamense]MTI07931.1 LysR family transcriptional regulator [Roseibium denhamense]SMP14959.1 transcriptional regulator, LysR family [Roseibium denhamense]